jgi:transposase-like protein
MQRKKEVFDRILNTTFFTKKESIPCKFCGSQNTVCDGFTYYKVKRQNYLCKSCKKHFTAPLDSNI